MKTKISCTKIIRFCSGHRVLNHESKCKRLHGHNYKAEITATADWLDGIGRVVDFSVIKEVIGRWIDNKWDHKTLIFKDDIGMIQALDHDHVFVCDFNPTAEEMARFLLKKSNNLLFKESVNVTVKKIKLWETDTCFAIAEKE